MNYGFLYITDHQRTGLDPEALHNAWYCHVFDREVYPLTAVADLPPDFVWISNLTGQVISDNTKFKLVVQERHIQCRNAEWLPQKLEQMATELVLSLPEQLPLLLDMVMRLLVFLEQQYGCTLQQPHPVVSQLAASIQWSPKKVQDHEFYQALQHGGFRPGRKVVLRLPQQDGGTTLTSMGINRVDLARRLQMLNFPTLGQWQREDPKAIVALDDNQCCLARIKPLQPVDGNPLVQALCSFLKQKALPTAESWWVNDVEYRFMQHIMPLECLELFVNHGEANEAVSALLPYAELDRLPYTRCLAAHAAIEAIIMSAETGNMTSVMSYWVKSAVWVHCLTLAEEMAEGGFCPVNVNASTGMFQFLHQPDNLGKLVQFAFGKGFEPNAAMFQGIS